MNTIISKTVVKTWKTQVFSSSKKVGAQNSAFNNATPYLTNSKVCAICGTSSDVASM